MVEQTDKVLHSDDGTRNILVIHSHNEFSVPERFFTRSQLCDLRDKIKEALFGTQEESAEAMIEDLKKNPLITPPI